MIRGGAVTLGAVTGGAVQGIAETGDRIDHFTVARRAK
jgi:hypothetical protein